MLGLRLQNVLSSIVSLDQNGYIKGRFIGNNIRTVIDTIEYTNSKKQKCFIAYLDFEKAFDKLNWSFLQNVLKKLGFGKSFRR